MDTTTIINFLSENPGSIPSEIGTTPVEMSRLEQAGLVVRVGQRKTGKRGRPPVEWAVTGAEVRQDERVAESIVEARKRVESFREYERLSAIIMHAANDHGYHSDERLKAIDARKAAFPTPPQIPAKGDYAIMGAVVDIPEGLEEAA